MKQLQASTSTNSPFYLRSSTPQNERKDRLSTTAPTALRALTKTKSETFDSQATTPSTVVGLDHDARARTLFYEDLLMHPRPMSRQPPPTSHILN